MYKNANTKEITIKLQIEDSKELQNIIEKIEKIQKEHSGDCILSVRFPTEVSGFGECKPLR